MTNERLRSTITTRGLALHDVAEAAQVDPKTVERWVTTGRVPHRRHRWAVATLLDADEAFLWPSVLADPRTRAASQAELVTIYPSRAAVPTDLWRDLVDRATEHVDVLVYAGTFLIDSHPGLVDALAAKAEAGCSVRLAIGNPESDAVRLRGEEEGIGTAMAARVAMTLHAFRPLVGVPGVEVCTHDTTLYSSIYRFDDQLLVNQHAYGSRAPANPVLHLRRLPGGRLIDHYLDAFDRVLAKATPLGSESVGSVAQ